MYDDIQIGLASDNNYYPGLFATAVSIAKFADKAAKLVFNIVDGGIAKERIKALTDAITRYHVRSEINFFELNRAANNIFPSKMNYARLLLPEFLPNVDHIIYCDVDFLWMADISLLWKLRRDDIIVQSTPDLAFMQESEAAWLSENGVSIDAKRYFCSGLMLINLKLFREYGIANKLAEFINRHNNVPLFDQTALNAVLIPLKNGVGEIPHEWQRYALSVEADDFLRPLVVHYNGLCPWSRMRVIPTVVVFWLRAMAHMSGCEFKQIRQQYYSRMQYVLGRVSFIFLSCVPFVKWIVGKAFLLSRGEAYATYITMILRHINCSKKAFTHDMAGECVWKDR